MSSVPMMCAGEGGFLNCVGSIASNGYGAIHEASRTIAASARSTADAASASLWRRNCLQKSSFCDRATADRTAKPGAARGSRSVVADLLIRDARIEPAVGDVRDEIKEDDEERPHHQDAHQERIVPREHRLYEEASDPRPGEDRLGDDRAGKEAREAERHDRHDGYERVLHGMPRQDDPLAAALCACRPDAIRPDDV